MKKYSIYYENEVAIDWRDERDGMTEREVEEAYDYKINKSGIEGDSAVECKTREEMLSKVSTSRPYFLAGSYRIDLAVGIEYDEDEDGNIENFEYHFAPLEAEE